MIGTIVEKPKQTPAKAINEVAGELKSRAIKKTIAAPVLTAFSTSASVIPQLIAPVIMKLSAMPLIDCFSYFVK